MLILLSLSIFATSQACSSLLWRAVLPLAFEDIARAVRPKHQNPVQDSSFEDQQDPSASEQSSHTIEAMQVDVETDTPASEKACQKPEGLEAFNFAHDPDKPRVWDYDTIVSESVPVEEIAGLKATDIVVVIDVQNDFVKGAHDQVASMGFGGTPVSMPEECAQNSLVNGLTQLLTKEDSYVYASFDYHPDKFTSDTVKAKGWWPQGHCSFKVQGAASGHVCKADFSNIWVPHCRFDPVTGNPTKGVQSVIPHILRDKAPNRLATVFKGFHPEYDSFSAFPYNEDGDISVFTAKEMATGGFEFKSLQDSNMDFPSKVPTVDAMQNVLDVVKNGSLSLKQFHDLQDKLGFQSGHRVLMRLLDAALAEKFTTECPRVHGNTTVSHHGGVGSWIVHHSQKSACRLTAEPLRIFLTGLVADVCVYNSANTAREVANDWSERLKLQGVLVNVEVFMVVDLARPVENGGKMVLGCPDACLTPHSLAEMYKAANVKFAKLQDLLR